MSRLEKIREMLQREPRDVFLRYALAMELDSAGQHDQSLQAYQDLMREQPPHVPAYFRAGQLLIRMGDPELAKSTLRAGIAHAVANGDPHAAGEMNELLQSLDLAADEL
jgi:hypothetical protein